MKALCTLGVLAAGLATLVMAAPPGPIDGQNIPSNFGGGNLAATQSNWTQFGDYQVTAGALLEGSEADRLFAAKAGGNLYVGISGNLATQGDGFMIAVGVPALSGQVENRSEGVGGPPFTLQSAARAVDIDTQGTPGDNTDDTWSYGTNGLIFPCETDFVVALDAYAGTASVSEYQLLDPTGPPAGTWDPTPGNLGDPLADLFAIRTFVAQGPTNDGNDVWEFQTNGYGQGGFDNSNVAGVTDTDGSSAATAVTGLEIAIPFARLGLTGVETISLYVLTMDGGDDIGRDCDTDGVEVPTGTTFNQVLPSLSGGTPCNPPANLGRRVNLSAIGMTCATVNLATLSAFGGVTEGDLSSPGAEGYTTIATQGCPTSACDQTFDPLGVTRGGGSELDEMYMTSDALNLYIGLTGNLEENGNKLNVWFDNGLGTAGVNPVVWDNMGPDGMEGDNLPPFAPTPTGPRPKYDYTLSINLSGAPPSSNIWVDLWDLVGQSSRFVGRAIMESGNGDIDTLGSGSNPWDMQVALNNLNSAGVIGCQPGSETCGTNGIPMVEAAAATATSGFEMAIPLADLGINPCDGPAEVTLWAHVTGGGGWRSNQSLPPMRHPDISTNCRMNENAGNAVTEWYDTANAPCGPNPVRYYKAIAFTHTTSPAGLPINDCDTDGVEDTCEILDGAEPDCNVNGTPDFCDIRDGFSQDTNSDGIPDECEGACCMTGGWCQLATPADCAAAGGFTQGIGTACLGDLNANGIDDQCDEGPCGDCPPGLHWADTCSAALSPDIMPTRATVDVDLDLDCIADTTLVLEGPTTVVRSDPLDDSAYYPGTKPVDGHMDVIDTEIVAMSLTGGGVTMFAGADFTGGFLDATLGTAAERSGDPWMVDSFFDVFFQIDMGGGMSAYNQMAVRVASPIECVPPDADFMFGPACLPLFNQRVGGTQVANLISVRHDTYRGCLVDEDCDDGQYCNGAETCDVPTGNCLPGTPVDCDDGVGCTDDSCNEVTDECDNVPNDENCPTNGLFCDGVEVCDALLDCVSTGDPCVPPEWCDEGTDQCIAPCACVNARSAKVHGGGGGRIELSMGCSGGIEPRWTGGGVTELEIDLDDASGFTGGVTVTCTPTAYAGAVGSSVAGNTVTLTFAPGLPNLTKCNIGLDCGASVCVRNIGGDANASGVTNATDNAARKGLFGQTANAGNAQWDVNQDGTINATDNSQSKGRFGNTAPTCP